MKLHSLDLKLACFTPTTFPWCGTSSDFILSNWQTKWQRYRVGPKNTSWETEPLIHWSWPSSSERWFLGGVLQHPGLGFVTCTRRRRWQKHGSCECASVARPYRASRFFFFWQDQETLRGGHPLWHQRAPVALGSWACELPQVIRERLEKTVTRKEISREGRSNKALNNSPSVESHWGHRPRD